MECIGTGQYLIIKLIGTSDPIQIYEVLAWDYKLVIPDSILIRGGFNSDNLSGELSIDKWTVFGEQSPGEHHCLQIDNPSWIRINNWLGTVSANFVVVDTGFNDHNVNWADDAGPCDRINFS